MGLFDLKCPKHGERHQVFRRSGDGFEIDGRIHYRCGHQDDEQAPACEKWAHVDWSAGVFNGGASGVLPSNADCPEMGVTFRSNKHLKQFERSRGLTSHHKDSSEYRKKKERWRDNARTKRKPVAERGPGRIKSVTPVKLGA